MFYLLDTLQRLFLPKNGNSSLLEIDAFPHPTTFGFKAGLMISWRSFCSGKIGVGWLFSSMRIIHGCYVAVPQLKLSFINFSIAEIHGSGTIKWARVMTMITIESRLKAELGVQRHVHRLLKGLRMVKKTVLPGDPSAEALHKMATHNFSWSGSSCIAARKVLNSSA